VGSKGALSRHAWGMRIPTALAYRRAGGRRRYNARRAFQRALREDKVAALLIRSGNGLFERGTLARIARDLGVHRSTVTRDVARLLGPLAGPNWRLGYGLMQGLGRAASPKRRRERATQIDPDAARAITDRDAYLDGGPCRARH
jgi:hypothetical protein